MKPAEEIKSKGLNIKNFQENFNEINNNKNSLFYTRPWWYRASTLVPKLVVGSVSTAIGATITVGTLGVGTKMGAPLFGFGTSLVSDAFSSSDAIKTRHTIFDIAQNVEDSKNKSENCLKKDSLTGNLFPYSQTYTPFTSARGSFLEAKKVYNFAKEEIRREPTAENIGVTESYLRTVTNLFSNSTGSSEKITQKVEDQSRKQKNINRDSSVPGTSISAIFYQKLSNFGKLITGGRD